MTNEEVIKEIRNLSNLFVMNSKPCKAKAGKEQPFRSGTEPFIQVNKIEIMFEPAILKAFDKAVEALNKQIPRKPVNKWETDGIKHSSSERVCPNCHHTIKDEKIRINGKAVTLHCKYCGQAIDWSDD